MGSLGLESTCIVPVPGESMNVTSGKGEALITSTVRTALARGLPLTPPLPRSDEKIACTVYAPLEIRSLIAMEDLRHPGHRQPSRNGKDPEYDSFIISWKPAWFDAQAIQRPL